VNHYELNARAWNQCANASKTQGVFNGFDPDDENESWNEWLDDIFVQNDGSDPRTR
jgi:hypothetical protein